MSTMPTLDLRGSPRLLPAILLTLNMSSAAAGPNTGQLAIEADGPEVRIALNGPATRMIGFDHRPQTATERETLSLATENLRAGNAMIRLPTQARCALIDIRVDPDPVADNGEDTGRLGADYHFQCSNHEALDSVAVGFFSGFPFLPRIHATYRIGRIRGEAVLTPSNPVVNLVPLR